MVSTISMKDLVWDWTKKSVKEALEMGGLDEIFEAVGIVRAAYVLGGLSQEHKIEALNVLNRAKVGGTNGQQAAIETARNYGWYQKEESDD